MKCLIISSVTIKSAITPSLKGRIALIFPGVLPNIVFASSPTAKTCFFPVCSTIATTDGFFFFQAEDGIRDPEMSRGLGDVYKRQDLLQHIKDFVFVLLLFLF